LDNFFTDYYYEKEDNYGEGIDQKILGACFGIEALVKGDKNNKITTVSRDALDLNVTFSTLDFQEYFQKRLSCSKLPVLFINDMVAIGKKIFIPEYEPEWQLLYEGQIKSDQDNSKENKAIMLVSGGLGQALWYWDDIKKAFSSKSSEGGHGLFAPRTEEEGELWLHLLRKKNQVISYEYVLSAPGLIKIYEFLKTTGRYGEESGELRQFLDQNKAQNKSDPTPIINEAINNSNSLSMAALDMFIGIMGTRAGDLALTYEAKGGIYIGGFSIPIEKLKDGIFKDAFLDKEGAFREYNEAISVYLYPEKDSVLLGAARHAVDAGIVTKGKFAY
jgi:glucokinase